MFLTSDFVSLFLQEAPCDVVAGIWGGRPCHDKPGAQPAELGRQKPRRGHASSSIAGMTEVLELVTFASAFVVWLLS